MEYDHDSEDIASGIVRDIPVILVDEFGNAVDRDKAKVTMVKLQATDNHTYAKSRFNDTVVFSFTDKAKE